MKKVIEGKAIHQQKDDKDAHKNQKLNSAANQGEGSEWPMRHVQGNMHGLMGNVLHAPIQHDHDM